MRNAQRGESLIETLAAMLIIVLGMTLLAGAVFSSARRNKDAEGQKILVVPLEDRISNPEDPELWTVAIQDDAGSPPMSINVNGYKVTPEGSERDDAKLYYYVPIP